MYLLQRFTIIELKSEPIRHTNNFVYFFENIWSTDSANYPVNKGVPKMTKSEFLLYVGYRQKIVSL
jgi:hypothetical protein